jgi:putative intracellular protease/amidase
LTDVVPLSIQDTFTEEGGEYEKGADFHPFTVTAGTLVTGQNPQSSEVTAQAVLNLLPR